MRLLSLTFHIGCIVLFLLLPFLSSAQKSSHSVHYSSMITPFQLTEDPTNFPLGQGTPAGDINGDGYDDMIVNRYAADERTSNLGDRIRKSVILLGPVDAENSFVCYDSYLFGIGDYNNDGFDDVWDREKHQIRFGSSTGLSEKFFQFELPENIDNIYLAEDLNEDGYSEFIIGKDYADSLFVFSGPDSTGFTIFNPNISSLFNEDRTIFGAYDIDHDGEMEMCLTDCDTYYNTRRFLIYRFQKAEGEFEVESGWNFEYIEEPSVHFPQEFTDVNGDGNLDFAHVYGAYDSVHIFRYNLEVFFGTDTHPFFSPGVQIETPNLNRFLYHAGDFNGDGSDDWYSKCNDSTIVVYYGSPDIVQNGFQIIYYNVDDSHLYLPQRQYYISNSFSVRNMDIFDYNQDSINDIYLDYYGIDDNKRFQTLGTSIIIGREYPDFNSPVVMGEPASDSYQSLEYGSVTKNVGDINKDGIEDWGVLASGACYVDIYFGEVDQNYLPDIKYYLPQTNLAYCFDWSSGDLNGDEWTDIIVSNGSIRQSNFPYTFVDQRREIFIFLGSEDYQEEYFYQDADFILKDTNIFKEFGKCISVIGDHNGDGYDDLVVGGASGYEKIAYLYLGGEDINEEPDLIISRENNGSYYTYFGEPISACGDINADGYDDFTLADPVYEGGQSLVYFGSPDPDEKFDMIIVNPSASSNTFGYLTARSEGDFNGDGYPDLFQYSSESKEILIFTGGPKFDSIHDYAIYDVNSTNYWARTDYVNMYAETGQSGIAFTWTPNPNCTDTNIYDISIYSIKDTATNSPDFVLKNRFERNGLSFASGDFDNDGHSDIITGIPYEQNYGNDAGGILYSYTPYVNVNIRENPFNKSKIARIFPNPASTNITISHSNAKSEHGVIIYNISGNKIYEDIIPDGKKESRINTSNLKPGVYILVIKNENGVTERGKFVKY